MNELTPAQAARQLLRDNDGRYTAGTVAAGESQVQLRTLDPWSWDDATEAEPPVEPVPTPPQPTSTREPDTQDVSSGPGTLEPSWGADPDRSRPALDDPGPWEGPVRPGADLSRTRELVGQAFAVSLSDRPSLAPHHCAARDQLIERFGTADKAVVAVGSLLAQQADEQAGFSADALDAVQAADAAIAAEAIARTNKSLTEVNEVHNHRLARFRAELDQVARSRQGLPNLDFQHAELDLNEAAIWKAIAAEQTEHARTLELLSTAKHVAQQVELGSPGPQTRAMLAKMAEAHRTVLADIRPVGGSMRWHDKTAKKAREVFDAAATDFPSSWLSRSNATQTPPLAKIVKTRAHYKGKHLQRSKQREPISNTLQLYSHAEYEATVGSYAHSDRWQISVADPDAMTVTVQSMETAHGFTDPDSPPRGRGWTYNQHEGGRGTWWRPRTTMRMVSAEIVPEITTNSGYDVESATMKPSRSVATHELSHRFEDTVPGIRQMEAAYLQRRHRENRPNWKSPTGRVRLYRSETALDAGLSENYMGKVYPDGSHELLSCGTEALLHGSYGGLVGGGRYSADQETRHFVLGVLACAGPDQQESR